MSHKKYPSSELLRHERTSENYLAEGARDMKISNVEKINAGSNGKRMPMDQLDSRTDTGKSQARRAIPLLERTNTVHQERPRGKVCASRHIRYCTSAQSSRPTTMRNVISHLAFEDHRFVKECN